MNKLQSIINLLSLQEENGALFLSEKSFVIKTQQYKIMISADAEENIVAEIRFKAVIPEDILENIALRLANKNSRIAMSGFSICEANRINKRYWFSSLETAETTAHNISIFLDDINQFCVIK